MYCWYHRSLPIRWHLRLKRTSSLKETGFRKGNSESLLWQNSAQRIQSNGGEPLPWLDSHPQPLSARSARSRVKKMQEVVSSFHGYIISCQCSHSMSIVLALPHLWGYSIRYATKSWTVCWFPQENKMLSPHSTVLTRTTRSTHNIWSS